MAENLPADAVCASWNAGQLGFFSQRRVVNLDGLINSRDYYERVLRADPSAQTDVLRAYLHEEGVTCLVDYVEHPITADLPVVTSRSFREGATYRHIHVWSFP